ncbi:MAG: hypothetical protein SVW77_01735 [Candidatus Nanohaloarchaea archaeon]|nr:hypothetical protein [Candidatus Nanohaloarchaea archaeon]
MEVTSQTPVSATRVLDTLREVEDRNEVQEETLEHLTKHLAVHDTGTLDELLEELDAVDGLRDEHRFKIIETLPRSGMEVRTLFSKERIKLEDSDIDQIVDFAESVGTR